MLGVCVTASVTQTPSPRYRLSALRRVPGGPARAHPHAASTAMARVLSPWSRTWWGSPVVLRPLHRHLARSDPTFPSIRTGLHPVMISADPDQPFARPCNSERPMPSKPRRNALLASLALFAAGTGTGLYFSSVHADISLLPSRSWPRRTSDSPPS